MPALDQADTIAHVQGDVSLGVSKISLRLGTLEAYEWCVAADEYINEVARTSFIWRRKDVAGRYTINILLCWVL